MTSTVGLVGLAVMGQARPNSAVLRLLYRPSAILVRGHADSLMHGLAADPDYLQRSQNLALNVAEKGFPISVYNRTYSKTEAAVARAQKSGVCCVAPIAVILCSVLLDCGSSTRTASMAQRRSRRQAARVRGPQGLRCIPGEAQVFACCRSYKHLPSRPSCLWRWQLPCMPCALPVRHHADMSCQVQSCLVATAAARHQPSQAGT